MMEYRSIEALAHTILTRLDCIPEDVDIVVGIPRSGMLAASLIALYRNLPLTDVDGLLHGRYMVGGQRLSRNNTPRHALVIDDSLSSGKSLKAAKEQIGAAKTGLKLTYGVIYLKPGQKKQVDLYFETCPTPRVFEWNIFHHQAIEDACVDIDGVLCRDPVESENDDGRKYRHFLATVKPKIIPSVRVGYLVTCRLEKYRALTKSWLKRHHVQYEHLVMMPYTTKQERIEHGDHADFKARVFKESRTTLFVESSRVQAERIFELTEGNVYCLETNQMVRKMNQAPQTVSTHLTRLYTKLRGLYGK